MITYKVNSIGTIYNNEKGTFIQLETPYIKALRGLDGFGHINVLWWFSDFDNADSRNVLEEDQPYKNAPEKMGTFATRSPLRPNPIALSVAEIINIDYTNGMIQIAYIDANDKTPILDIKPYTPSLDRVESPNVPNWCSHWPHSLEESDSFAWENEFNF